MVLLKKLKAETIHFHHYRNFKKILFFLISQRKLSVGSNSDPEATLDTTAGDGEKSEKKKKKKRKKENEADESVPAVKEDEDNAEDDESSKKEKKKKKKKDKNKEKSDE